MWLTVHRPQGLQESFMKLLEACNDTSAGVDRWLSRLDACNWLGHIKDVLTTACVAAQCLDRFVHLENASLSLPLMVPFQLHLWAHPLLYCLLLFLASSNSWNIKGNEGGGGGMKKMGGERGGYGLFILTGYKVRSGTHTHSLGESAVTSWDTGYERGHNYGSAFLTALSVAYPEEEFSSPPLIYLYVWPVCTVSF